VGLLFGAWGSPLPRRVPLFQVTGVPVVVGLPLHRSDPAFEARVAEVHARFVAEMRRIYDTHRGTYGNGFEDRPLVIV
jgi:hypothetical protein